MADQDQMPAGFEAGLVKQPPPTTPPPTSGEDVPEGFGAALTQPPDHPTLLQQFWAARPHPIEEAKGFVKGAGNTIAGLLDAYANAPGGIVPGVTPGAGPGLQQTASAIRARSQINNAAQEQGSIAETIAEFYALPELQEEKIAGEIPSLSEHLADSAKLAKFLEGNTKIARLLRIGINTAKSGARAGVEQGTQTYLKTEDPEQAESAAVTGTLLGGAVGGGAGAFREAQEVAAARRAGTRNIAGAGFETNPKTGDLLLRNLKQVGQDPATQATDEALGNIAKTGVVNSIKATNAARAPEPEIIPPSRQLPGRAGFTVGAAEEGTTPTKEGEILQPARKKQIGTRTVEGKGSPTGVPDYQGTGFTGEEAPPPPREVAEPPTERGSHREPIYQYLTSARPGTQAAVEGEAGPTAMIFTDQGEGMSVERARQQLAQYDRILNDEDALGEMSMRQHRQITAARDDLADQLHRFDNYAASQPHFPAPDPLEVSRNTSSLSDAAEHLKAIHGRFWDAADNAAKEAGDETFSSLRDEEKRLRKQIYGETPTGKLDELREQLADNQQRQMDFFDKYRTTVSPEEWATARRGYQDGIVLQNLDDFIQGHFNGITRAEEGRGVARRIFDPSKNFNNQLENFFNKGFRDSETNREVLERTIGQPHMDDLKRLGSLFQDSERMDATQGLFKTILSTVSRHYHGVKGILAGGALAGGAGLELAVHGAGKVAGLAGLPMVTGTVGGIRRYVTEQLMTNPEFMRQFTYAVENKIPPRTAGALLASRVISSLANQPWNHKTFSNESKYATPDAPHWEGDRLIDKNGRVVADETPKKGRK